MIGVSHSSSCCWTFTIRQYWLLLFGGNQWHHCMIWSISVLFFEWGSDQFGCGCSILLLRSLAQFLRKPLNHGTGVRGVLKDPIRYKVIPWKLLELRSLARNARAWWSKCTCFYQWSNVINMIAFIRITDSVVISSPAVKPCSIFLRMLVWCALPPWHEGSSPLAGTSPDPWYFSKPSMT